MTAANQALSVVQAAEDRLNSGKFRLVDEVVVALWEDVIEKSAKIRELSLKISYLEMNEPEQVNQSAEYSALLSRLGA